MRAEKTAVRNAQFEDKRIVLGRARFEDLMPESTKDIDTAATPVGSVAFCEALLARAGAPVNQHCGTYPASLTPYLRRPIRTGVFGDVPEGWFVKPRFGVKRFTGHLKGEGWPDDDPPPALLDSIPVFFSPPVNFVVEARCYVRHGRVQGITRYVEPLDGGGPDPDPDFIDAAVAAFEQTNDVSGYALDVGVLDTGETALVEWNDGWALGYYPDASFPPTAYVDLIETRWQQMLGGADR